MEELDEFEVLWPETSCGHTHGPPTSSSPLPLQVQPSEAPAAARSRPVDVPSPKAAARACRWDGPRDCDHDDHGGGGGRGNDNIVPPHLLLSVRRRSEAAETAWTLRAPGPPCKRARDLHHLRDSVLRMTGFIEGALVVLSSSQFTLEALLRIPTQCADAIAIFPPKEECLFAKARHHRLLPKHTAINPPGHGHIELCPSPTARPYHIMEEFQEAEILWPGPANDDNDGGGVGTTGTTTTLSSDVVRSQPASPELSAPVEISRRKRRCRPWAASEHATFDQETDGGGDGDGEEDGGEQRSVKGLTIVPPHVLLARRRLLGGRTAAYSMCAGKGRTLKGRDLRDVRNLVLKMTGFIEK
ncbi:hypothetical protein BAE44_0022624 [Dichanthelium oligosanthes]|uniref:Uncharacterized protein n=1 Tax=Dichanthelium oligosanthes TaxID=888268 RepID=A0A1E5UU22_9POAL|nr:hypothetical protein BAE44_0022624 [Dichanthelium oligosanthes]